MLYLFVLLQSLFAKQDTAGQARREPSTTIGHQAKEHAAMTTAPAASHLTIVPPLQEEVTREEIIEAIDEIAKAEGINAPADILYFVDALRQKAVRLVRAKRTLNNQAERIMARLDAETAKLSGKTIETPAHVPTEKVETVVAEALEPKAKELEPTPVNESTEMVVIVPAAVMLARASKPASKPHDKYRQFVANEYGMDLPEVLFVNGYNLFAYRAYLLDAKAAYVAMITKSEATAELTDYVTELKRVVKERIGLLEKVFGHIMHRSFNCYPEKFEKKFGSDNAKRAVAGEIKHTKLAWIMKPVPTPEQLLQEIAQAKATSEKNQADEKAIKEIAALLVAVGAKNDDDTLKRADRIFRKSEGDTSEQKLVNAAVGKLESGVIDEAELFAKAAKVELEVVKQTLAEKMELQKQRNQERAANAFSQNLKDVPRKAESPKAAAKRASDERKRKEQEKQAKAAAKKGNKGKDNKSK